MAALCLVGGLLVAASLPPMGFWPLAVPGLVLLERLLDGTPVVSRFRRGMLFGLALLAPTTWWMHSLTFPGWVVASIVLAGVVGSAMTLVPPGAGRLLALPAAWTLAEGVRGRWPFGGVPLSNLAVGQVAGPLAPVARVGASLLVGFATVVAAVAVAAALRRSGRTAAVAAAFVLALLGLAAVAPDGSGGSGTRLTFATVQGGGPQGTLAIDSDPQVVFDRHLTTSRTVDPGPDVVLWPENVVDVEGPVEDTETGDELAAESVRLDAVLIAGVIEGVDDEHFRNAAIAFDGRDDGAIVDRVDKERRVPFGEYVPFRSLIEPIAPAALTARDALVGEGEPILDTAAGRFGVVISWEAFFPDRARHAIGHGGEVLLNPTNGSSFTGTQVQTQQVASNRLRAIETGRWVVQAAPTGFSAFIAPDGTVLQRTGVSERRVLLGEVELRTGRTWSVRTGDVPTVLLCLLTLAAAWRPTRSNP